MPWFAQEHKFARHRNKSVVFLLNEHAAQARSRWHVRGGCAGLGRHPKNICCFIGERENAHRARAHVSKCAPRVSDSSILLTRVGPHDFACRENEHHAMARAPFSTKWCTARRREHRGASTARRPEATPPRKHLFKNKVYVRRGAPCLDGRAMRRPNSCN